MNDNGVTRESEFVLRRLSDSFPLGPPEASTPLWFTSLAIVLLLGFAFVIWSYLRDMRSIRWYIATPLALMRMTVYVLLAIAFLLPAVQTWEKAEKRSRVIVVLDVSPSITQIADEISANTTVKPKTRLDKVLDFLTDEKVAFVKKLVDQNPVFVYRFGTRLDEEVHSIIPEQAAWTKDDWKAWTNYDFKPWALQGLSPVAQDAVKKMPGWQPELPGNSDWAVAWAKLPEAEAIPGDLSPTDVTTLKDNRAKLEQRVDVARTIVLGTNVPDSLTSVVNREAPNMVQGIIVFTDGRSNLGTAGAYTELKERASREKIPIFTITVGEARENISITMTDVQAPDRAPPDEQFKIVVEADGIGLEKQEVEVRLGLYLPGRDPKKDAPDHELTQKLEFQPGDPPHGQAEFVIDPDKLPEVLTEETKKVGKKRQLKQGAWAAVARIARDKREIYPDPDHVSPPRVFQVIDKPLRVLLFASGPSREYLTLQTLLDRETRQNRAELSICLQSEGGKEGTGVQSVPPERLLARFPTRLDTTNKATDKPEDKYYNLNEYDLIIAFDPDWSELSDDQITNLQTWVDNLGGGLIYVAGPIHTFQLARAGDEGRLRPLIDILPVVPDDIILIKTRPVPRSPRRLGLKPSPDFDVLKLDDEKPDDPTAGWERYFTGRDKYVPDPDTRKNAMTSRGMYAYYPVKDTKPGATVLAEFMDVNERGDIDLKPWLVTTQPSRGRTAFLASGELWRLRALTDGGVDFYERFWVKLSRYISANRDVKAARGRVLMGKEFVSGSPVRVQARLLDPSGRPYEENRLTPKFKIVAYNASGEPLNKQFGPFEMKAKKGGGAFDGYYSGQILADPRLLPPGDNRYRVVVDVPDSPGDTIDGEFLVRKSDPELDNARPDFSAMYAAASTLEDVQGRITDSAVFDKLKGASTDGPKTKLAFRLSETDKLAVIPDCMKKESRTLRIRGPVEDLWDKPLALNRLGIDGSLLDFQLTPNLAKIGLLTLAGIGLLLLGYVGIGMSVKRLDRNIGSFLTAGLAALLLVGGVVGIAMLQGHEFDYRVQVGAILLIAVTLLSIEWMVRKLLRLA